MPLSNASVRFHQLDTLRFLFAIMVAVGHGFGWDNVPKGGLAVDFFFVLSGFVLAHMIILQSPEFGRFALSRFARLWPLHFATLLPFIALYLNAGSDPAGHLGISFPALVGWNLALFQAMGPVPELLFNNPSWSISVEFWLNLLILYWVVRYRLRLLSAALVLVCFAALAVFSPRFDHAHVQPLGFTNYAVLRCTAGILLGALLYDAYRFGQPVLAKLQNGVVWGAIQAALLLALVWSMSFRPGSALGNAVDYAGLAALIFLLTGFETPFSRLFAHPLLSFFGKLSFAIYMLHMPLLVLGRIFGWFVPDQWSALEMAVFWPTLMLLSVGSYYLIEMPARKFIMSLLGKRKIQPPAETAP